MPANKRGALRSAAKLLKLNSDIAWFLAAAVAVLGAFAAWDFRYYLNLASISRFGLCLVVFAFIINTRSIHGDPSIRFLAPSFIFIATFEVCYALATFDPTGRVDFVAEPARLTSLWFQAFSFFLLPTMKSKVSPIWRIWVAFSLVAAGIGLALLAGILPLKASAPAYPAFFAANLAGICLLFAISAYRIRLSFRPGRYRRRLSASAVFSAIAAPVVLLASGSGRFAEFAGEALRLIGLFLAYKAVVSQSLMRPYRYMFRDIGLESLQLKSENRGLSRALEEKKLLLREVHHRVKNNLQIISSLLDLAEVSEAGSAGEVLSSTKGRVQSVAALHDLLYRSDQVATVDLESFIRRLVDSAATASGMDVELEGALPAVAVSLESALPLGLALNELLTNAAKHGARAGDRRVCVRAFVAAGPGEASGGAAAEAMNVALEIADRGPGLPELFDPRISSGLGLTLVRSLTAQLGGSATWKPRADGRGVVARIDLPINVN